MESTYFSEFYVAHNVSDALHARTTPPVKQAQLSRRASTSKFHGKRILDFPVTLAYESGKKLII